MIGLAMSSTLTVALGLVAVALPKWVANNLVVASHIMISLVAVRAIISTLLLIVAHCLYLLILDSKGHVFHLLYLFAFHLLFFL